MSKPHIKMAYIAEQFRIRIEFNKSFALETPSPPPIIYERAKRKLAAEHASGRIAFFNLYNERLEKMWQLFRDGAESEETTVAVTLATGCPRLFGVHVESQLSPKDNATVGWFRLDPEFDQNPPVSFEIFRLWILHKLAEHGKNREQIVNSGSIYVAWHRSQQKLAVEHVTLKSQPKLEDICGTDAFVLEADPSHGGIEIIVCNLPKTLQFGIENVVHAIRQKAHTLFDESGLYYRVLKQRLETKLISAARGPERYGLDMPIVMLAASLMPKENKEDSPPKIQRSKLVDLVSIDITDDLMHAYIGNVKPAVYDSPYGQKASSWLHLLEDKGIVFGIQSEAIQEIIDLVKKRAPLHHMEVAKGIEAKKARDPFFYAKYLDHNIDGEDSVRDHQNPYLVRRGQVVGEFRFEVEARAGRNIFDQTFSADLPDLPILEIGDGIDSLNGMKFVAMYDGLIKQSENRIELSKILVCDSDVNLATGNIYFQGDCIIKGNIDAGAIVEVTGDLEVHGMITAAKVRVGGNLKVLGGIITGPASFVKVKGDFFCVYIERSIVHVGKKLLVQKCILSSQVYVNGSLLLENGVIVGGETAVLNQLIVGCLGEKKGVQTTIRIGKDPNHNNRISHQETRLAKLVKAYNNAKLEHHAIKQKKSKFNQEKIDKKVAELLRKKIRIRSLIEKNELKIVEIKKLHSYDLNASLIVSKNIFPNTIIEVCGRFLHKPLEVGGVKVHFKNGQIKIDESDPSVDDLSLKGGHEHKIAT